MAALVLVTGSCTTPMVRQANQPIIAAQAAIPDAAPNPAAVGDAMAPPLLTGDSAFQANAALPVAALPNPAASALAFAPSNPIAGLRALDCLAQAIYYEARSESEEGQRAVAQVVLNRVRHPAWPNSVCGVVYQGPLRPGGGCQFTFTCDGSLRFPARGEGWARARRLATEALAGRVFEPVGLSTFYHANYVMPAWAPRLLKTAVIGSHLFYRLPGSGGTPRAFSAPYAGVEPLARPNPIMVRAADARMAGTLPAWITAPSTAPNSGPGPAAAPTAIVQAPEPVEDSRIRPEYRSAGQWREDAPAAISGR
jgi:spore germination cell wall hydrolase CwlJ-like protein